MKLLLISAFVICACVEIASTAGGCPPPSKIYEYTKKESCRGDGECKSGKICCLNPAGSRSCTNPDPHGGAPNKGTTSVTCEGVKCQPYEVCKADPKNPRRMKCQRP